MLTGALFMLEIYDRVLPSRSVPTLVALLILAAGLYAAQGVIDAIRSRILVRIGHSLDEAMSMRVYDAVVRLPLKIGSKGEGTQPIRDLDTVRGFLSGAGPSALFDLPWMPVYLAICFLFHTYIGLTALAGAIILVAAHGRDRTADAAADPQRHAIRHGAQRADGGQPAQRRGDHRDGHGRPHRATLGRPQSQLRGVERPRQRRRRRAWRDVEGFAAVAAVGHSRGRRLAGDPSGIHAGHHHRRLDPGRAARWRRSILPSPIGAASSARGKAGSGCRGCSATCRRGPSRCRCSRRRRRSWCRTRRCIRPGEQKIVCQDVNFSLAAGNALGVIGPTASGKSSLARMLVGVWTPVRGSVRLDGATLDQWSPEALGRHIGYLPQDVELFPGNVAQNIARFEDPPDAEAVLAAAQAAGVHDLIVNLPDGYETNVGDRGSALSAGQAQRIALARALYRDPFLVVLDEPNSNLDAEGDEALTRAILGMRARGAIVVVVAHRPSAIAGRRLHPGHGQGPPAAVRAERGNPQPRDPAERAAAGLEGGAGAGRRRMSSKASPSSRASIRRHIIVGCAVVAVLAVGLGGWASTAEISGALIAQGSLVVDSNVKKVQHPTGGVVGEVRVRDGDRVKAGDILIRLDETVTRANLAIVTKGLTELYARKARLAAERDGADTVAVPKELADRLDDPDVKDALASERKLFELRRTARLGQKDQLQQRVKQLQEQITGLTAQQDAKAKEIGSHRAGTRRACATCGRKTWSSSTG